MKNKAVKIKICGITSREEIDKLAELQVDYVGLVLFFEKSKRNNTLEAARDIVRYLREKPGGGNIRLVAVTVSPKLKQIEEIEKTGFDILQVHGSLYDDVKEKCHLPIFQAFNIDGEDKRREMKTVTSDERIAGVVLDGAVAGSGIKFDWKKFLDFDTGEKLFVLAGGLNPDNVGEAIRELQPDVVDVSSGVEYDDGKIKGKDLAKVEQFVKAVRQQC